MSDICLVNVEWENGFIKVVNKEGLIQLKKIRNSRIDQDDIENLQK